MPKLGILGGTFNPVHLGHLLMAETARDQLQLDRVLWVPTRQPPHRSPLDLIDVAHRVEMVKQAIAPHPAFTLSLVDCAAPLDVNHPSPSYAVDTLAALKHQHPNSQWYWILGLDAFQSLPRWYRRHEWIYQCHWLVLPRRDRSALEIEATETDTELAHPTSRAVCEAVVADLRGQNLEVEWSLLQMPLVEISSSLIRRYRGDRRSIRYLVPDAVWNYITAHNLYG
jgi:nicotinate-nucleotide adenylyltransferase